MTNSKIINFKHSKVDNSPVALCRSVKLTAQSKLLELFGHNLAWSRLFDTRSSYPYFAENIVEQSKREAKCLNLL